MRLLHTSDWHLGASEGTHSLYDDQMYFIDGICKVIDEEKVDAVIIAGDVYDRSLPSADAVRLYDYAMSRICGEMGRQVLVIAGNHDSAERLSTCSSLLARSGLYVAGSLTREPAMVHIDNAQIFLLPWITADKVRSIFPERKDEIHDLTDAYRTVTDNYREHFERDCVHIIAAHAFITDAETSTSDRAAEIGFASQVSADVFEGFDYVALGHIHKPQDVNDSVRYSGTPMPYSFGREESQTKSVTIIDTADMDRRIVPLPQLHRRTTIEGTLEELLESDVSDDIRNGYVRLRVTDSYLGLAALSQLGSIYPNILEASGKTYEGEDTSVTMTLDELDRKGSSPDEIFRYFCRDTTGEEPDEHLLSMFRDAVTAAGEVIS